MSSVVGSQRLVPRRADCADCDKLLAALRLTAPERAGLSAARAELRRDARDRGYTIEAVYHVFGWRREACSASIEAAAAVGARSDLHAHRRTGWTQRGSRPPSGSARAIAAVRACGRAGRRRPGHRERVQPVRRHPHRPHAFATPSRSPSWPALASASTCSTAGPKPISRSSLRPALPRTS